MIPSAGNEETLGGRQWFPPRIFTQSKAVYVVRAAEPAWARAAFELGPELQAEGAKVRLDGAPTDREAAKVELEARIETKASPGKLRIVTGPYLPGPRELVVDVPGSREGIDGFHGEPASGVWLGLETSEITDADGRGKAQVLMAEGQPVIEVRPLGSNFPQRFSVDPLAKEADVKLRPREWIKGQVSLVDPTFPVQLTIRDKKTGAASSAFAVDAKGRFQCALPHGWFEVEAVWEYSTHEECKRSHRFQVPHKGVVPVRD